MLFSEFQQGTGCKDNEYNHKVYRDLEVMYMNDDSMTKEQVYEYGKKLVDNSKTLEELALEEQIKSEIGENKDQIEYLRREIEMYQNAIENEDDKEFKKIWKNSVKRLKEDVKRLQFHNKLLKQMFAV